MVPAMLERVTGVRADRSVHPDEAVALGAAICAAEVVRSTSVSAPRQAQRQHRRPVVHEVTAHSLGVVARSGESGAEINSVVVARNTPIPAAGRRRFHTLAENQREILIVVTEGEDSDPAFVSIVGSARVTVPEHAAGELTLDVVLSYTADGMIDVNVVDPDTDAPLGHFVIDRQATMDAKEVARMREALDTLALGPADSR